jgi:hypothetical protein
MTSDLLNCESHTHGKDKATSEIAHRYPTRSEVEKANNSRLAQISENPVYFYAVDRPGLDEEGDPRVSLQEMKRLLDRLVALPTVVLKVIQVTCCYCIYLISARPEHKLCSSRHVLRFDARAKLQLQL